MNYGNPHQDPRGYKARQHGLPRMDTQPRPDKRFQNKEFYNSMVTPLGRRAGFDGGNRRPIYDRNGGLVPQRPVIGEKFKMPAPVPIMDYVGSQTASMDPGSKYNGTYKQEGYGDPRFDDFGQDEFYDFRDGYMDDVIDPGLSGYDRGPLYFS